jgi:hypothetical protein
MSEHAWHCYHSSDMTYVARYCLVPHPKWLYLAANGCKTYLNLNLNQHALCGRSPPTVTLALMELEA